MTYGALADLLWPVAENRDEAKKYYRSALADARKGSNVPELTNALWALGRVLADTKPGEARRLIREALVLAVDSGNATTAAYAWRQQMRLVWKMLPRERAAEESMRALGAIESLRTLQDPGIARAAVLAAWTPDYHWLIGALLDTKAPTRAEVALAFEVAERMRARLLLDSLQRVPQALKRESVRRQQLLRDISAVQYRLLDPRVQGAARAAEAARLERLEREEEEARVELETAGEGSQAGVPPIASLKLVERALGENEVMLSFSVGVGRNFYGVFAGGAWLLASTNAGTRVIPLPDRTELHPAISIFRGLAEGTSQANIPASVRLYEIVLGEALAALPKTINRLIVIPDGPLHHLPFAALRSEPESRPLGSTHEIVVAPSASVWMRLRQTPRIERSAALVLADPAVPEMLRTDAVAQDREWLPGTLQLGRLPYSRREGRTIVTTMGRGSQLLTGRAATESALKAGGLDAFLIVHFATHALVDEGQPDRSAVLLAGEEHREDGLLQAREIADLALPGRVVVLSACRSATGAVLAGEGVLGLSRAFFEAGARTIVGTLWAVRDDQAAAFFEAFYASFGRGLSVGAAMRNARQQAITQEIPASVWSSIVVMGDDTVAAIPPMDPAHTPTLILLVVVSTFVVTIVFIMVARRKARRTSR
jgi:CHAT domain-containing protein